MAGCPRGSGSSRRFAAAGLLLALLLLARQCEAGWRGTKAQKTCKVCEFLVSHVVEKPDVLTGISNRKKAMRALDDCCENYKGDTRPLSALAPDCKF